ncbi:MAG: nucleotidyltransferase domain-containing protein [Lachnospiraceae bacterium]|nr:nucleotidyltransferase domain-containing protein [Lachnospiraceae bacterium]
MKKRALRKIPTYRQENQWKVYNDCEFLNCNKIFPFQQKKVEALVGDLSRDDNVEKIVIFGSSVTNQCHAGSDVDLYVQLKEDKKLKLSSYYFTYDLWTNFNVDARMMSEIEKKGVTVYERNIASQGCL